LTAAPIGGHHVSRANHCTAAQPARRHLALIVVNCVVFLYQMSLSEPELELSGASFVKAVEHTPINVEYLPAPRRRAGAEGDAD
jgi:hypothetical protein